MSGDADMAYRVEQFLRAHAARHRRVDIIVLLLMTLLPASAALFIFQLVRTPIWVAIAFALAGALLCLLASGTVAGTVARIELRATAARFQACFPAGNDDYPKALALLAQLMNSKLAADLLQKLPGGAVAAAAAGVADSGEHGGLGAQQLKKLLTLSGVSATIAVAPQAKLALKGAGAKSAKPFHAWIASQNAQEVADLQPATTNYSPYEAEKVEPPSGPVIPKIKGDGLKKLKKKATPAASPMAAPAAPTRQFVQLDPFDPEDERREPT